MSWDDATAYTRWLTEQSDLTVRLPTEAEWEMACRGSDGRLYPWGNVEPNERHRNLNPDVSVAMVGNYPEGASPFGALDMVGNVAEWTADWFSDRYSEWPRGNPTGPDRGTERVWRGGGIYGNQWYSANCVMRGSAAPTSRFFALGFRVVVPNF